MQDMARTPNRPRSWPNTQFWLLPLTDAIFLARMSQPKRAKWKMVVRRDGGWCWQTEESNWRDGPGTPTQGTGIYSLRIKNGDWLIQQFGWTRTLQPGYNVSHLKYKKTLRYTPSNLLQTNLRKNSLKKQKKQSISAKQKFSKFGPGTPNSPQELLWRFTNSQYFFFFLMLFPSHFYYLSSA